MFSGISPLLYQSLLFPALSSKTTLMNYHKERGIRGPFDSRMEARKRASSFWKRKLKSLWSLAELWGPACCGEWVFGWPQLPPPSHFWKVGCKGTQASSKRSNVEDKGYLEPGHFSTGQHCPGKLEILAVTGCRNWRFLRISLQEKQSSHLRTVAFGGNSSLLPSTGWSRPPSKKSNKPTEVCNNNLSYWRSCSLMTKVTSTWINFFQREARGIFSLWWAQWLNL